MKNLQVYVAPATGKNPVPLNITRKDLNIPGARCWVLNNFLSRFECEHYIDAAEKLGYESIESEYPKEYRDCVRVVAKSAILSEQLWSRLMPHLHQKDIEGIRPYGYGNEGLWGPFCINDCFRLSKYFVGGHFDQHRDGAFVPSETLRSIYTLMVYLNDDFEGGATQFFDEQDQLVLEFKPQRGTAIIFNHDVKHSGAAITAGHKYIVRTDIMFCRIAIDPNHNMEAIFSDPDYLESDRLYAKSFELQKAGHATESTQAFLAAMAIASQRPSISPKSSLEKNVLPETDASPANNTSPAKDTLPVFNRIPIHVWLEIFQQLSLCDILNFGSVSKYAHLVVADPSVWRYQYFARWSPYAGSIQALLLEHQKVMHRSDSEGNASSSSGAVTIPSDLYQQLTATMYDWYNIYRYRALSDKEFQIVVIDIGGMFTKFFGFGLRCLETTDQPVASRYRHRYIEIREWDPDVYRHKPPLTIENPRWSSWGKIQSIFNRNSHTFFSFSQHIMFAGDPELRYYHSTIWRQLYVRPDERQTIISLPGVDTIVRWIYINMFDREISCQQHPLLYPVPSWMHYDQQVEMRKYLFEHMQIPYLAMIDASVLALQSHGLKTGILVSVGGMFTYVAAVVEGAVLDAPVKKFEIVTKDNSFPHVHPVTELDEFTVLGRYFSTVSPDPSVNPVDLVHLIDQCLQKAAVPEDTKIVLKKHVVVSGGHAYAVVPILRSKLAPSEYEIYGPSNSEAGQFDVVRGAEHLLTMPQTKETIRNLFTSIDEYAASVEYLASAENFKKHSRARPEFYKKVINGADEQLRLSNSENEQLRLSNSENERLRLSKRLKCCIVV